MTIEVLQPNSWTPQEAADYVSEAWQKAVGSIIETGRRLIEAKQRVDHGDWFNAVALMPFGESTADYLMQVAHHPDLSNPQQAGDLPASWYTLSVLAQLPEGEIPDLIAAGEITAETRRIDAQRIVNRRNEPQPSDRIPPLPGTYRCIIVDPPWPMAKIEREVRPLQGQAPGTVGRQYPTMTIDQLKDETWCPVDTHADDDCHLYLWITHKYLKDALALVEEWGFRYQCVMTWVKNVGITPFSWMYDTEHVLFATRGNLKLEQLGLRLSFSAMTQGHSIKPDVFYERVAAASPGPRLEMFARTSRDGFDCWGNEVGDAVV